MRIDVKNATKRINSTVVLDDITVSLDSGRIYGIQGPNGSGKTMFLRLLAGLIKATSGEVCIDGAILGSDMDFPSSVGILIENPAFLLNYTGVQNLELLASLKGRINTEQIRTTIKRVGLNPDDNRKYRKFSLGMKQRLGIAAAIMEKPDLILVDEPTNALDDNGIKCFCNILRQERERGALIVLACHDGVILHELSDVLLKIYDGKIKEVKEI